MCGVAAPPSPSTSRCRVVSDMNSRHPLLVSSCVPRPIQLLTAAVTILALESPNGAQAVSTAPSCRNSIVAAAGVDPSLDTTFASQLQQFDVPGAAIAVVRNGQVELLRGYGCANLQENVAVDPRRTVFKVASVSKPLVATAVLHLVESGAVDLRTDVNTYLKTVAVPHAFDRPITLHDLLTHTAGFDESVVGYAARTVDDIRPLGDFLAARLPRRGWPPGVVTGYSNYGYALAGYVVESVSGLPFHAYMSRNILAPLGMLRSTFTQEAVPPFVRDLAVGYRCSQPGGCDPVAADYRSAYPAGGLLSTAEDMSRFMLMHLGSGPAGAHLLSDATLHRMHARQFTLDSHLPGMTYGFAEDGIDGTRALSHTGGIAGFSSVMMLVPERQLGVFVAVNGGSSRFGRAALSALSARRPGAPDPIQLSTAPPRPDATATVDPTGSYRLTRYAHRGIENLPMLFLGQLHVAREGADRIVVTGLGDANGEYVAIDSTRWRRVGGQETVAVRVHEGRVTHLFGPLSFFGGMFPAAFERLAWYDRPYVVNELISWLVMIPVIACVVWPVTALISAGIRRRRRRDAGHAAAAPRVPRWAIATAIAAAALSAGLGFGFIAQSNRAAEQGGGVLIYGLPRLMQLLAYSPTVLAGLAVLLSAATVLIWRPRRGTLGSRLILSIVTLDAWLFVVFLAHWGYFPLATG